jgi:hypothetical protein
MPKQIINLIGIVVSLGIIALGVALVAVPMYLQSLDVSSQTATVANTNAVYQAQVDNLRAEEERIDEIDASVAALHAQIPAVGQLDDVFELVGKAAAASGATVQAVTAGVPAAFTPPVDPTLDATAAPVAETPAPDASAAPEDAATDTTTETTTTDAAPAASGRQQVDFVISVTAADEGQVTAFLDALRAGPRLLSNVTATSNRTGEGGYDVQVSALTFVDKEG